MHVQTPTLVIKYQIVQENRYTSYDYLVRGTYY